MDWHKLKITKKRGIDDNTKVKDAEQERRPTPSEGAGGSREGNAGHQSDGDYGGQRVPQSKQP